MDGPALLQLDLLPNHAAADRAGSISAAKCLDSRRRNDKFRQLASINE